MQLELEMNRQELSIFIHITKDDKGNYHGREVSINGITSSSQILITNNFGDLIFKKEVKSNIFQNYSFNKLNLKELPGDYIFKSWNNSNHFTSEYLITGDKLETLLENDNFTFNDASVYSILEVVKEYNHECGIVIKWQLIKATLDPELLENRPYTCDETFILIKDDGNEIITIEGDIGTYKNHGIFFRSNQDTLKHLLENFIKFEQYNFSNLTYDETSEYRNGQLRLILDLCTISD